MMRLGVGSSSSQKCPIRSRGTLVRQNALRVADLNPVDLVLWPDGKKPARLSRSSLNSLRVQDLRAELVKRGITVEGLKPALIDTLLAVVEAETCGLDSRASTGHSSSSTTDSATHQPSKRARQSANELDTAFGTRPRPGRHPTFSSHAQPLDGEDTVPAFLRRGGRVRDAAASYASVGDIITSVDALDQARVSRDERVLAVEERSSAPPERSAAKGGALTALVAAEGRPSAAPWPAAAVGAGGVHLLGLKEADEQTLAQQLQSNVKTIAMWALGTSSLIGTPSRHPFCLAMRCHNHIFMFDCGDDAQRQLRVACNADTVVGVKPLKIVRIFITSCDGSRIWGLPGMLCSLSAVKGDTVHENSRIPMHVYGPPGLAAYLELMLVRSDTNIAMPLFVFEFVAGPVAEADREPVKLHKRSNLYKVLVPADQYNPDGYTNANLEATKPGGVHAMRRLPKYKKSRLSGVDERGGFRPTAMPPPGDPARPAVPLEELTWTFACDGHWMVTAVPASFKVPSVSYVLSEPARAGNLRVDRCQELMVRPGRDYADLKAGRPVVNESGDTVLPEQVVSPDVPGRRVVVTGLHPATAALKKLAAPVDVIVHEAWLGEQEQLSNHGLPSAADAVSLANSLSANVLVLSGVGALHQGRLSVSTAQDDVELTQQVSGFEGAHVVLLNDLDAFCVGLRGETK